MDLNPHPASDTTRLNGLTSYCPLRLPMSPEILETTSKSCMRSCISCAKFSACPEDELSLSFSGPLRVKLDKPKWLGVTVRVKLDLLLVVPECPELEDIVPVPPKANTLAKVPPAAPSMTWKWNRLM